MYRNVRSYENREIFVRQVEMGFEEGPQLRILPNLRKSRCCCCCFSRKNGSFLLENGTIVMVLCSMLQLY